jgi:quercetin dioxygenase-like cupin family protein
MKVMKPEQVKPEPVSSALFTGAVSRRTLVPENESAFFNMSIVEFPKGVRNKFHAHESDQVLIVTKGRGIVATDKEQRPVGVGDVIHVKAGEKHWHGAGPDSDFAHITITKPGSKTTQLEQ